MLPPSVFCLGTLSKSEEVVQAALDKMIAENAAGCTIVIAHRLSTVRNADKIIVLDSGSIVETRPPPTLMDANGLYARMVHSQDLSRDWGIYRDARENAAD